MTTTTRRPRRRSVLALAVSGLLLASCGSDATSADKDTTEKGSGDAYPVTLDVCGSEPVTIESRPERVITTAPNITEYFLALGLGDQVVGHFGGELPVSGYVEEYETIEPFSVEFNLEEIVALEPDLIYAGFGFGFENGTALSPDGFAERDIDALPLFGSCTYTENGENQEASAKAAGLQGDDLEATYVDVRTIGQVFGVEDEAEALIDEMQTTVDQVQESVADADAPRVFFFAGGDATPGSAGAISTPNALIELGGGENIFHDLQEDYTTVSWEAVVEADPECILVKNGSNAGTRGEDLIEYVKTSPITKGLTAVKDDCFLELNQDHLTPGPLNAWAVQAVANWLHPDLVDAPEPTA